MQNFSHYKSLIDGDIAEYSHILTERWQQDFGIETAQILDSYLSILSRGGKRFRGSLGMWAYSLASGDDEELATRLARSLEMIHAYLLVIDDVADLSETRRGGLSAHILIEKYHDEEGWFGNAQHFGETQAVNASLAAQHLVMQEITELPVGDTIKLEALRELNVVLFKTGAGQIADINYQAMRDISEREVLTMMKQKTAYYSFVSPLQFGIIMAGKDWSEYAWLEEWAINIGLGFQINDDIIGVFGDEKVSGKSSLSDIKEGKLTLLVVRALTHANVEQKTRLLQLLGSDTLSQAELEEVQVIIENSGALDYCRALAQGYASKAVVALETAPSPLKESAAILKNLSQAIVNRQS